MDLLFLRVSQINGCAYCVDLHARDLRLSGESNERLDGLAGWRESSYFTGPEKAALEWAEALTHVDVTHAPDAAYEPLARQYEDKQVVNITYAIALMNAWNRVAIGFHHGPMACARFRLRLKRFRRGYDPGQAVANARRLLAGAPIPP
jgi:AhpD family alkylhydroperoxidase